MKRPAKTVYINLRATPEQRQALKLQAKLRNLSLSAYILTLSQP